ncbi:conserved hypothetical Ustilaginaceae-specific protein [Sporisorium reilianum SRZ2]|uniref:Conserved hypothetical Ustilaginaceae-specific protein n=1 Tax=Sporisorium reilianum (strain SRZ2) TaxID=999809 RepID=E6ZS73_SPORE|nr:conserved hypothetical Ustilaginaceae-specific protein [Sporisorium reilianum SRZ2]
MRCLTFRSLRVGWVLASLLGLDAVSHAADEGEATRRVRILPVQRQTSISWSLPPRPDRSGPLMRGPVAPHSDSSGPSIKQPNTPFVISAPIPDSSPARLRFGKARATKPERGRALQKLRYRPNEYGRDGGSLQREDPVQLTPNPHLYQLEQRLKQTLHEKKAIFLSPSRDLQGRLVALPYAIPTGSGPVRLTWAILEVHPSFPSQPSHLRWYDYASHVEPDRRILEEKLARSSDVKTLKQFLTRRL